MILDFVTQLSGVLNGDPILVNGRGRIDEAQGLTEGDYDLNLLPRNFPVEILSTMKVTGYPNASKTVGRAINPFKNQSYHYVRELLVPGGKMQLHSDVRLEGTRLVSIFTITGSFGSPGELGKVAPIREQWRLGIRQVQGEFAARWLDANGQVYTANASTAYTVNVPFGSPDSQYRDIVLETERNGRTFKLQQRVELQAN